MSIAEKYLSYATPPIISSSEFTSEFIQYQPSGSVKDFAQGDSFTISLANLNKAQYLVPDSCFLTFDISVSAALGATPPTSNRDTGVMHTVDTVPRPAFGCAFFDQATVSTPGSSSFDALPSSAEETAQYWYSTRLLASSCSAEGAMDRGAKFRLPGRYNFAGGKSGFERAGCISGARRIYEADGTTVVAQSIRGNAISYAIPLSAFCTLFCKSSSLIPIGMLSSGGESLVFQFTVARAIESVLGVSANTGGWGAISFNLFNPRILASVVRIQNPTTTAQLSALYDARIKAVLPGPTPDSPPTSISLPMVIAHKRFIWARSLIPKVVGPSLNSSSAMALTFSGVNEPSVSAIVLRFRYRPGGIFRNADKLKSCATKYLGAEEPDIVLRDIQARINDQLIPLKGLSDEGVSSVVAYAADGVAKNPKVNGETIVAQTSQGISSALWDLGRQGLGLFMEESHQQSLSDVVFDRESAHGTKALVSGTNGVIIELAPQEPIGLIEGSSDRTYSCLKTPMAIVVIPLTTMPQLVGDYSNSHTLRSWDLRSVSTFSVTGSVQVKQNAVNQENVLNLNTYVTATESDIIVDGALVCDGMLRLAAGSSDNRYIYTAVSNATVASM